MHANIVQRRNMRFGNKLFVFGSKGFTNKVVAEGVGISVGRASTDMAKLQEGG